MIQILFLLFKRQPFKSFLKYFSTAICLCCIYSHSPAQNISLAVDSLMTTLYDRAQFNGSVLVATGGKVIYANGFGIADISKSINFTRKTTSYLASLSKQFTAMAVMMLEEQNKLTYEDKLSKYFPEFPSYANNVTIRNLLNHTSGIPDYFSLDIVHPGLTNKDVLNGLLKQDSLQFRPGDKFEYSNSNYVLLAMITEKVSGISLSTFMKKNIFGPLGMNNTLLYDTLKPEIKNRAYGYTMFRKDYDDDILTTGDGGIFSTVDDLFKWDQALYTEKLIKQTTLNEAFKPAILNDGSKSYYGFGWGIIEYNGKKIVTHAGEYNGFNTIIFRELEGRKTIIFLANIGGTQRKEIRDALYHILEGKPYTLPKLFIGREMYKMINKSGISTAISFYDSLKKSNDTTYRYAESELNLLGYQLLSDKNVDDAIEIFKLNIESYPELSNPYESLGEAYMQKGDNVLAMESFRKALEIDPNNRDAISMMKKIEK